MSIFVSDYHYLEKDKDIRETDVRLQLYRYIQDVFQDDRELVECSNMDYGLDEFFSKCLDRIDKIESYR